MCTFKHCANHTIMPLPLPSKELLGPLASDKFAHLVALGKLVTDWVAEGEAPVAAPADDLLNRCEGSAV